MHRRSSSSRKSDSPSVEVTQQSRSTTIVVGLLLIVATVIVFGQVAGFGLLAWDDSQHLVDNPHFDPLSWSGIGKLWIEPYFGEYVPLTYTYYAALAWLSAAPLAAWTSGTFDPAIFHLGNLVLHIGCTLAVFGLLHQLIRDPLAAGCGAALFALHPMQVESVAWVSEARGLLCGLLGLTAVWILVTTVPAEEDNRRRKRQSPPVAWRRLAVATLVFAGALLAKPSAVAAPLIAAALLIGWHGRLNRPLAVTLGVWLAMAMGLIVITQAQQPLAALEFVPSPAERVIVAGHTLAFYAAKIVWPFGLAAIYDYTPQRVVMIPGAALFAIIPFAAVGLLWFAWRPTRWRPLAVAGGIWLAAIAPVLGLVSFNFQNISTVADRYLYLAMLGPALAVAWFIAQRDTWRAGVRSAVFCGCGLLLLALSILAHRQCTHWRDDVALWTHTLEVNQGSIIAHGHLGSALALRGDTEAALAHFEVFLRHKSTPRAINNVAWILATAAEPRFRNGARAIELAEVLCAPPRDHEPSFIDTLAAAYAEAGRYEDAVLAARRAVELAIAAGRPSLAAGLQSRLELYEQQQPYHETPGKP